ncbi:MAG: helix-turn-helix domain-containing protein [Solirubrobacteraceae bacterium]
MAAQVPERLSLRTLAALCDIFDCTPDQLIDVGPDVPSAPPVRQTEQHGPGGVVELATTGRPRRARVAPRS